jgi:hypothetical protein
MQQHEWLAELDHIETQDAVCLIVLPERNWAHNQLGLSLSLFEEIKVND